MTDAQIERRFREVKALSSCQYCSVVILVKCFKRTPHRYVQADLDGSGAIDFAEFYSLWFSLTRPNEVTLQEVKNILKKR